MDIKIFGYWDSMYETLIGIDLRIVNVLNLTPQSMNEIVRILLDKDLIFKTIDPAHKRILRLSLTESGKDILTKCNVEINAVEKNLFGDLSQEEYNSYRLVMGKILEKARTMQKQLPK